MTRTPDGERRAARADTFVLAAVAVIGLSAFLMIGPLFLDAFQCRSPIGLPSLRLGPSPMWVRPVTCAFGSALTFLDIGFVGLLVASVWAVHARQRRLAVLALAFAVAGAAWLFFAVDGPAFAHRIVDHLARLL